MKKEKQSTKARQHKRDTESTSWAKRDIESRLDRKSFVRSLPATASRLHFNPGQKAEKKREVYRPLVRGSIVRRKTSERKGFLRKGGIQERAGAQPTCRTTKDRGAGKAGWPAKGRPPLMSMIREGKKKDPLDEKDHLWRPGVLKGFIKRPQCTPQPGRA